LPDQAVTRYVTLNIAWPGSVYIQTPIRLSFQYFCLENQGACHRWGFLLLSVNVNLNQLCTNFYTGLAATSKFQAPEVLILSMFHTKDPKILNATVQNSAAPVTWHPRFMHP
jgi:hypothetical protein